MTERENRGKGITSFGKLPREYSTECTSLTKTEVFLRVLCKREIGGQNVCWCANENKVTQVEKLIKQNLGDFKLINQHKTIAVAMGASVLPTDKKQQVDVFV